MKPFTLTAIAASVLATVTYPSVQAQETPSNSETVVTAPVVVTATRTEKKLNEAPSSLVVITDGQLEQDNPKTLGDALLDIPNVMMEAPDSPVFTRISIRGSDSDQITYLIDGVRQDNYTMSGNRPAFMFADPEMIKQIEVRRGGGSSLYGNGGIGGTIAVTTKTAADLLKPTRFWCQTQSRLQQRCRRVRTGGMALRQEGTCGCSHRFFTSRRRQSCQFFQRQKV